MDTVTLITAIALMWKLVDFAKFITNRDWNATITQLVTWVAGVGVISLFAASDFAEKISIGDGTLGGLNGASLIIVGLGLSSTGSVLFDAKKARDNNDSAVTPPLIPPGGSG